MCGASVAGVVFDVNRPTWKSDRFTDIFSHINYSDLKDSRSVYCRWSSLFGGVRLSSSHEPKERREIWPPEENKPSKRTQNCLYKETFDNVLFVELMRRECFDVSTWRCLVCDVNRLIVTDSSAELKIFLVIIAVCFVIKVLSWRQINCAAFANIGKQCV